MRTPLRRYYHGRNLVAMRDVQAGTTRYYHFNHQGTVQCLTNEQGQVTDRFAADAWGRQVKRTGTSINRQWYIGNLGYYREIDRALDYVRARYLAPARGRWSSRDFPQLSPFGASLYPYTRSRPAVLTDPTGLVPRVDITRARKGCRILEDDRGNKSQCGGGEMEVQWGVPGRLNGWIVQHVKVAGQFFNCRGDDLTGDTPVMIGLEYWEAWPVLNGQVGYCDTAGRMRVKDPTQPHDEFRLPDRKDETCGEQAIHGWVKFYATKEPPRCTYPPNLPDGTKWIRPPCPLVPFWNIGLWCAGRDDRGRPPTGLSDTDSRLHYMAVTWNCCLTGCNPPHCPPRDPSPNIACFP